MLEITDTLTNELLRDMESVLGLVAEAGRIALERAETATPEEKSNATYVTDLDKDLEKLLRAELAVRFPQDTLTGEEYPDTGTGGPRLWSIDPIDGTGNLVHQLPLWAISVGLAYQGEPVLGVIAIPQLGETYSALIIRLSQAVCGRWVLHVANWRSHRVADLSLPRSKVNSGMMLWQAL